MSIQPLAWREDQRTASKLLPHGFSGNEHLLAVDGEWVPVRTQKMTAQWALRSARLNPRSGQYRAVPQRTSSCDCTHSMKAVTLAGTITGDGNTA